MADLPALIFDLDGTLIDSAPDIHATANKVFSAKGLEPFPFEVVRGFIGNGVDVLVARLLSSLGLRDNATLQAELVANFIDLYEEAFDLTRVYPGVIEALAALDSMGVPMGICTNKPTGPAQAALRHFGMDGFFRVVIGGDSLPQRKPDPAPLLAAVADLARTRALFVGDSEVDSATAMAGRIPFALFTEGYRKTPADRLSAKLIFGDYPALPGLVAHLGHRLPAVGALS